MILRATGAGCQERAAGPAPGPGGTPGTQQWSDRDPPGHERVERGSGHELQRQAIEVYATTNETAVPAIGGVARNPVHATAARSRWLRIGSSGRRVARTRGIVTCFPPRSPPTPPSPGCRGSPGGKGRRKGDRDHPVPGPLRTPPPDRASKGRLARTMFLLVIAPVVRWFSHRWPSRSGSPDDEPGTTRGPVRLRHHDPVPRPEGTRTVSRPGTPPAIQAVNGSCTPHSRADRLGTPHGARTPAGEGLVPSDPRRPPSRTRRG